MAQKEKIFDAPPGWPRGRWSPAALRVLGERYLRKDSRNQSIETPEGIFYRVVREVAGAEKTWGATEKEIQDLAMAFYALMVARKFIPNSPTLMNAGTGNHLQYSACFVLPVKDSIEGIFRAVKEGAIIHQSGGGTGYSFSRLRPKGSTVRTASGVASGPVSFMKIFDTATGVIKQGGKRRGANMGILRVDHPDILEFTNCKAKGEITNFNISVGITEEFMAALKKKQNYPLRSQPGWPAPNGKSYEGGEIVGRLSAPLVFQTIVKAAWQTGDPGVIFLDRLNDSPANPLPELYKIEATNPCGEQPLYPYEACNLGSINLALMVKEKEPEIDWAQLEEAVQMAVRFLDDVIETNPYPFEEINRMVKLNRRIGLGVMGWADLLFQLGIPYDSEKAVNLAKKVMKFINQAGHEASAGLAKERGGFPNFSQSIYRDGQPLRNATVTTIAPTGSIGIIADCSSGIEPIYALAFSHIVGKRHLQFVNSYFAAAAKKARLNKKISDQILKKGMIDKITSVSASLKKVFVTAHEVPWQYHVKMQAAFQKYTDNAVSKTINLINEATEEEVADAYLLAYRLGCRGITVFRDRCREEQVLHLGRKEPMLGEKPLIKPRPDRVTGTTYRTETPVGTAFITVNHNGEIEPLEIFVNVGKAGSDVAADAEAMGRLISLCLRISSSYSPREVAQQIVDQLSGIGGSNSVGLGERRVRSLADGIAKVLREHLSGEKEKGVRTVSLQYPLSASETKDLCPSCGNATLRFEEGCAKCTFCGFSKC